MLAAEVPNRHWSTDQPRQKRMRTIVVTANAHMATGEVEDAADYIMYKPIDVMEFTRFVKRLVLSTQV
jgi:hypothetical protein